MEYIRYTSLGIFNKISSNFSFVCLIKGRQVTTVVMGGKQCNETEIPTEMREYSTYYLIMFSLVTLFLKFFLLHKFGVSLGFRVCFTVEPL